MAEDDALQAVQLAEARQLAASGHGKAIRVGARLSQKDVAAAAGTNAVNVLRWETGQRKPTGAAGARWGQFLRSIERLGLDKTEDEQSDEESDDEESSDDEEPAPKPAPVNAHRGGTPNAMLAP